MLTPFFLAKPSPALVKFLFSSKATVAIGPFTTFSTSGCEDAIPSIRTASLRGVAITFTFSNLTLLSFKKVSNPVLSWDIAIGINLYGNSSTPISNKYLFISSPFLLICKLDLSEFFVYFIRLLLLFTP